jgi:hypothetical protein
MSKKMLITNINSKNALTLNSNFIIDKIIEINSKYADKHKIKKYLKNNEKTFNIKWNERYGNELLAAVTAYHIFKDPKVREVIELYIKFLLSKETFSVKGMEHDEVNTYHIILSIVCAAPYIKDNALITKKINQRVESILAQSILNSKSNWYVEKCQLHNHVFHILALRYLCIAHLSLERKNTDYEINKELLKIRESFKKNLSKMIGYYRGLTYESISYMSYSFISICIILLIEEKVFHKRYDEYSEISKFGDAVDFFLVDHLDFCFNYSDAPQLWSYGPEQCIKFLDGYFYYEKKNPNILRKIYSLRERNKNNPRINSNPEAFIFLNFIYPEQDNEHRDVVIEKCPVTKIDEHCVLRVKTQKITAYQRYGTFGGINSSFIQSKNIGHDYPLIGSLFLATKNEIVFSNPLYLIPKRSSFSGASDFSIDGKEFFQIGSYEYLQSKELPLLNWLSPKGDEKFSPSHSCKIGHFIIIITKVRCYEFKYVQYYRLLLFTPEGGSVIIDVIKNPTKQLIILNGNFPNSVNKFVKHQSHIKCEKSIISASENNKLEISNHQLKCHQYMYNLSLLKSSSSFIKKDGFCYISINSEIKMLSSFDNINKIDFIIDQHKLRIPLNSMLF